MSISTTLPGKVGYKNKTTMSRKIRYIAPVESISGNLSGSQDLLYPTNVKAWNSQGDGFAQNYTTRYIGVRRNSDGKLYFAVKQRTKATLTTTTRTAMAIFGGAASCTSWIMHDAEHLAQLNVLWRTVVARGNRITFHKFIYTQVYPALADKASTIQISDSSTGGVQYKNPWVEGGTGTTIGISADIITKFAPYLGA